MTDVVGDVAFAKEAVAHLRDSTELGAEQLDGDPPSVAMGGRIDAGHPPHPDERIQGPLAAENGSNQSLGFDLLGTVRRHDLSIVRYASAMSSLDLWR